MKPNLKEGRVGLRLSLEAKNRAYEQASKRNLSINQYIELLIEQAESADKGSSIADQISELKEKHAKLEETLSDVQKKLSGKPKK